jgi:hypothetical protein
MIVIISDRTTLSFNLASKHLDLRNKHIEGTQEQEKQATGSPVPRGFGSTRYRKDGPVNI